MVHRSIAFRGVAGTTSTAYSIRAIAVDCVVAISVDSVDAFAAGIFFGTVRPNWWSFVGRRPVGCYC